MTNMAHTYKAPNLAQNYYEVDANDNFFREMQEAAGADGVYVTEIGRALPLQGDAGQFNKARHFVVFTGQADNSLHGRPNAAQQQVLQAWGAKSFPDLESFQIGRKVATDIADGVETRATTEPYEAFAQPAFD